MGAVVPVMATARVRMICEHQREGDGGKSKREVACCPAGRERDTEHELPRPDSRTLMTSF
jgi:hypothetical protein